MGKISQLNNCLKKLKVPVAYGRFRKKQEFPFIIMIGAGSTFFRQTIILYFTKKMSIG